MEKEPNENNSSLIKSNELLRKSLRIVNNLLRMNLRVENMYITSIKLT